MIARSADELGDAIRLARWKPAAIRRAIEDHGHALPVHVVAGMHAEADAIEAASREAALELFRRSELVRTSHDTAA